MQQKTGYQITLAHSNVHRRLLTILQHVQQAQFQNLGQWSLSEKIINTNIKLKFKETKILWPNL